MNRIRTRESLCPEYRGCLNVFFQTDFRLLSLLSVKTHLAEMQLYSPKLMGHIHGAIKVAFGWGKYSNVLCVNRIAVTLHPCRFICSHLV